MEGAPDTHNHYPSVVRVTPKASGPSGGLRSCSGVIVSPRLVLTAGHCVCRRRQVSTPEGPVEHRVDRASCVDTATVDVFFYEHNPGMPPPSIASQTTQALQGTVRPHAQLEVRLNASGDILSSNADLAIVALDRPVPPGFQPSALSKTDITLQEPLVLAGFGHDEDLGLLDTLRLTHTIKVTAVEDSVSGRYRLERRETDFFRGDSGGPCFRTSAGGPLLVGISTTGLGREPTMLALRDYFDWLQEEIARAEAVESIP
nr:trypsin-like serine protease [Hyalangium gracile]